MEHVLKIEYIGTYNEENNKCTNYYMVEKVMRSLHMSKHKCDHMRSSYCVDNKNIAQKRNFIASKVNEILNLPYSYNFVEYNCENNSITLDIDEYLQTMQSKKVNTFPIFVNIYNIFENKGHQIAIIINIDKLIIIDSSYAAENMLEKSVYDFIMSNIRLYIEKFNFDIKNVINASDIVCNVQNIEENTNIFIDKKKRNGGNCSYWSFFLALFIIQNIDNFDKKQSTVLLKYIHNKTTLYHFITAFAHMMCDGHIEKLMMYFFQKFIKNATIFIITYVCMSLYFAN